MINELLFMNGYAVYVMSAFGFTLLSFLGLYMITKLQFVKEQTKFVTKYKLRKLIKVKPNAENTYPAYPFIKNNSLIIIYLSLYF